MNIRKANIGNRLLDKPNRLLPEKWKQEKKEYRKVKRNDIQQAKAISARAKLKAPNIKAYDGIRKLCVR